MVEALRLLLAALFGAAVVVNMLAIFVRMTRATGRPKVGVCVAALYLLLAFHPRKECGLASVVLMLLVFFFTGPGSGWLKRMKDNAMSSLTAVQASTWGREMRQVRAAAIGGRC